MSRTELCHDAITCRPACVVPQELCDYLPGHRLCLPYAMCGIDIAHNATSPCRTPSLAIVLRGKLAYQPTSALLDVQYCHTTTVPLRVIDVAYPRSPRVHTLSGANAAGLLSYFTRATRCPVLT
eukprot:1588917-Rhodomonas_salina.2